MKRYMLFEFDKYYPCGGMSDFTGSFDSLEECLNKRCNSYTDCFHVYDTEQMEIIESNYDYSMT